MYYGDKEIDKVYYGGVEIDKIYHGSDLVYEATAPDPYPVGTVVLEKVGTTEWETGTVEILGDGLYDAIFVGPGAGGASGNWTYLRPGGTAQARRGAASGGAGGVFIGRLRLKKGTFSYQIPPNGKGVDMKDAGTVVLGDTIFGDLYLSGAQGGNKSGASGYSAGGRGGQKAMNNQDDGTTVIVSTTTNENGADGTAISVAGTVPDVASAYQQYGFGGGAMYSTDSYTYNDGGVGYIKVVYVGQ